MQPTAHVAHSSRPSRRVLPALLLLTTTQAIVSSLGAPMVPEVARTHGVSLTAAQWVLTAAMLTGALATPVVGRLGGNRLRRVSVLTGLGVVCAGLLLSALPFGFAGLIAGRILQGVGTALLPLALAAARETFPPERIPSVLGLLTVSTVAGSGLGYPLTAWTAQSHGLPGAYLVGLILTSCTFVVCWRWFPQPLNTSKDHMDWPAAGLLTTSTLCFLLAVSGGPLSGWLSPHTLGLLLISLTSGLLWGRRCLRSPHPLVDLRLAGDRATLPVHVVGLLAGIAIYMTMALAMIQVQSPPSGGYGLGRSLLFASSGLTAYALGTIVGNRVAALLRVRIGLAGLLQLGFAIYTASSVLYLVSHLEVWSVPVTMTLGGLASGFSFAALPALVVRSTPMQETGSALSFNTLLRFIGFALGSALGSSLLVTLTETTGSGAEAFRWTLVINTALWVLALAVAFAVPASGTRSEPVPPPVLPPTP